MRNKAPGFLGAVFKGWLHDTMMTLGTIGAFGFPDFPPHEIIGLYAEAGCTVLQAYRDRHKGISAQEIVSICKDLPVTIDSLHGFYGDDLDPSCEDEAIRTATVSLYEREAEYCLALGGHLVVVHPSPGNAPVGDLENRYAQLQRTFHELARVGERTGVTFAFENMPSYHPVGSDVQRLVEETGKVGSRHIIFLLDVGHAHMTCGVGQGIRIAGSRIGYTHVHDNDGVNDTHALPYKGNLPWDVCREELHKVGYDGVFLLESFETAADLRRLLSAEWKQNIRAILNHR